MRGEPYRLLRRSWLSAVLRGSDDVRVSSPAAGQPRLLSIKFDSFQAGERTYARLFRDFPAGVYAATRRRPVMPVRRLLSRSSHATQRRIYFANLAGCFIDRHKRTVDLVLHDGVRDTTGKPGLSIPWFEVALLSF